MTMRYLAAIFCLFLSALQNKAHSADSVRVYPAVAMQCNHHSMYFNSTTWNWRIWPVTSASEDCHDDPTMAFRSALHLCQQIYPHLNVTQVVPSSQRVNIPHWCTPQLFQVLTQTCVPPNGQMLSSVAFLCVPNNVNWMLTQLPLAASHCYTFHKILPTCADWLSLHASAKQTCQSHAMFHQLAYAIPLQQCSLAGGESQQFQSIRFVCCTNQPEEGIINDLRQEESFFQRLWTDPESIFSKSILTDLEKKFREDYLKKIKQIAEEKLNFILFDDADKENQMESQLNILANAVEYFMQEPNSDAERIASSIHIYLQHLKTQMDHLKSIYLQVETMEGLQMEKATEFLQNHLGKVKQMYANTISRLLEVNANLSSKVQFILHDEMATIERELSDTERMNNDHTVESHKLDEIVESIISNVHEELHLTSDHVNNNNNNNNTVQPHQALSNKPAVVNIIYLWLLLSFLIVIQFSLFIYLRRKVKRSKHKLCCNSLFCDDSPSLCCGCQPCECAAASASSLPENATVLPPAAGKPLFAGMHKKTGVIMTTSLNNIPAYVFSSTTSSSSQYETQSDDSLSSGYENPIFQYFNCDPAPPRVSSQ